MLSSFRTCCCRPRRTAAFGHVERQQQLGFQQQQRQLQQRRLLSSTLPQSTFPASSPPASWTSAAIAAANAAASRPPQIVSRRAFLEYQKHHADKFQLRRAVESEAKDPSKDKPWPNSVIYSAYVAAITIIPYTLTWMVANNVGGVREAWVPPESATEDFLRRHFGSTAHDEISYSDIVEQQLQLQQQKQKQGGSTSGSVVLPLRLPDEPSAKVRKQQAEIRQMQQTLFNVRLTVLPVNAGTVTHANNTAVSSFLLNDNAVAVVTAKVKGSTLCANDELLNVARKEQKESSHDGKNSTSSIPDSPSKVFVAVDILNNDETPVAQEQQQEDGSAIPTDGTLHTDPVGGEFADTASMQHQGSISIRTTRKDPLLAKTQIFSTWHYQPPLQPQQQQQSSNSKSSVSRNSSSSSSSSKESLAAERAAVEAHLAKLERELKEGTRAIDDILEEQGQYKKELRRLKWKGWWPS